MIKFLLDLFFISSLLNFAWEISQMRFYSPLGMGSLDNYNDFVKIHWEVSLKDALVVVVAYLLIGFLIRNWQWVKTFNSGWIILSMALPLWQGIIEYYSVYMYSRWAYTGTMPLLFGIGLSPLLQMLILPSIAILLSRHYLNGED
ncbi:MAG: hypothetical protein HZB99_04125 [Candidatus Harrisonbacteria bacterium]|nr:hypothetical protein [Candidatus Harrisonbacteria bacterium]